MAFSLAFSYLRMRISSSLQLEERTSTPVFRQLIVRMVMLVVVKTIAEIMDNLSSFVSDE